MKKVILVFALAMFAYTANAQSGKFNLGVNLGLVTGDADVVSSFAGGVEANYLFSVSDNFDFGPSVGFVNFFGKDNFDDASFMPLAGAARFKASEEFTLGADLGYGVGISPDGNDGGFYYRPMVGYNVSDKVMLQATYSGISVNNATWANFGIGAMFAL